MDLRTNMCILFVFVGCCANVIVLEKLTNNINGVANLITFLQFIFISVEGFIFTSKCGTKKSRIPIRDCSVLVLLFFISSVCNNFAYNFNVPTTLHIIIKSGSLITNMIVGVVMGRRHYAKEKYVSVALVTIGIIICTISSTNSLNDPSVSNNIKVVWWSVGITLLTLALVLGAFMGLLQEDLYNKCGKHPKDVLYYTHILPLPLFLFLYNDLMTAVSNCKNYESVQFPHVGNVSAAWFLLFLNVFTQYICIRSVYILTSECTSLTVTLVLTLRKFLSLIMSVILFDNIFTLSHWFGTVFVFCGTCMYSDLLKFKFLGTSIRQA